MAGSEYVLAWTVYITAGIGCCMVWWKITGFFAQNAWRDMARGIVLVLVFTPWYAGESPEFYAPALLVLLMDLLLEGAKTGLKGGLALLASTFLMLLVLSGRVLLTQRRGRETE